MYRGWRANDKTGDFKSDEDYKRGYHKQDTLVTLREEQRKECKVGREHLFEDEFSMEESYVGTIPYLSGFLSSSLR